MLKKNILLYINLGSILLIIGAVVVFIALLFGLIKLLTSPLALIGGILSLIRGGDVAGTSYFELQSNEPCYLVGPPVSKAIRVERRRFYITSYCPPATGYDRIEGGQISAAGIKLAMGAVAVPPFSNPPVITGNTPNYPWGTTFDIPGYGRGVAVDRGAAIQKAGVSSGRWKATPYDHLDVFVGWGSEQCQKWGTKILDVTVYWFDPKEYPPSRAKDFIHRICDWRGWEKAGGFSTEGERILNVNCIGEDYAGQCGVASAAMVIDYMTGKRYTTSQLAGRSGTMPIQATLDRQTGIRWVKSSWDFGRAARSIMAGYPVILYSRVPGNPKTQHIMVMRGYANGKFLINDPLRGKACRTLWATISQIQSWGPHNQGYKMIFPANIK